MASKPQKRRTREPQEVRKAALINATMEIIAEHGLSNVTSQKVAGAADMTAAMVNFHFKGKTALLHSTLQFIADEFTQAHEEVSKLPLSPQDMLKTLLDVSYSEKLSDFRKIAVWYAFYSEARSREDYTKICSEHDDAYYQAYYTPIKELCNLENKPMNAHAITLGLIGIVEHSSQTILVEQDYDRAEGKQVCLDFLDSVFDCWKN